MALQIYEHYTFTKVKPNKADQKESWALVKKRFGGIAHKNLRTRILKQKTTAQDQYEDSNMKGYKRKQIDWLRDGRNSSEDPRFEWLLASIKLDIDAKTKMTSTMYVIIKRQACTHAASPRRRFVPFQFDETIDLTGQKNDKGSQLIYHSPQQDLLSKSIINTSQPFTDVKPSKQKKPQQKKPKVVQIIEPSPSESDSLSDKDAFSGAETDGTPNTIFSSEDSHVVHEVERGRRLKSEWESFVPSDRSSKRDTRYFGHERRSPSPGARRREIRYPLRDVKTRSIGDRARYLSPMAYREHRPPRAQYHYNDGRDKKLSVDRYPSAYGTTGFATREPKYRYHDDKQYLNRLFRDRERDWHMSELGDRSDAKLGDQSDSEREQARRDRRREQNLERELERIKGRRERDHEPDQRYHESFDRERTKRGRREHQLRLREEPRCQEILATRNEQHRPCRNDQDFGRVRDARNAHTATADGRRNASPHQEDRYGPYGNCAYETRRQARGREYQGGEVKLSALHNRDHLSRDSHRQGVESHLGDAYHNRRSKVYHCFDPMPDETSWRSKKKQRQQLHRLTEEKKIYRSLSPGLHEVSKSVLPIKTFDLNVCSQKEQDSILRWTKPDEYETQSNVIEADLLGDDGGKLRMDDEKVMSTRGKRKDTSTASLVSSKSHKEDAKITKLIEGSRLLSGRRAKNPHSAREISPSLSSVGAGEAEDMSNRGLSFSESASNPATTDELDSSDETQSMSSNNDAGLVVVYAKHQMLVRLMREVYSLFDQSWSTNPKARTHGSSSSDASSSKFGGPNSSDRSSRKNGKRPLWERNSSPFDDDDQNNKKRGSKELKRLDREQRFACPFHKFDPRKYCSNDIDGFKYRACAGPGFTSIARLKQHLKRTHGAPLQCQRCWQIMSDSQAMINHANDEIRCERREAQPLGIPQHKMDLIHSKHGPSWEAIFDILFPGAPVPSPYHEISTHLPGNTGALSPSSQELADFEAYNRTALPLLVEANLQGIIDAEVAPIEENLRNLVVDIVRRCQSTVSQNYQSFQGSVPSSGPSTAGTNTLDKSKEPQETMSTTFATHGSAPGEASGASWFFSEPPLLDAEASDAASRTLCDGNGSLHGSSQNHDSGYGSLRDICKCECHDESDGVNGCLEEKYCEMCAMYHIAYDVDMDFDEFIDLPHF